MRWIAALEHRRRQGNLRRLRLNTQAIDFASNDYLGMARSPLLKDLTIKEWQVWESHSTLNGLGSTGSRLLTGNSRYAEELENGVAHFHGFEAGVLYHCGYLANSGLISSVAQSEDLIFYDAQVHASTRDGIRLSHASAYPFRHNELEHLEKRLRTLTCAGKRFVCIESIYSVDGSIAPLHELSALCRRYGALLIVDEAHAVGAYGPQGKGLVVQYGIEEHVFALVVTFGKALGAFGAMVLGTHALKNYLINFSRPCIYSTALPMHNLASIKSAYALLPTLDLERQKLMERIAQFRQMRQNASFSAIQSINIGDSFKTSQMAEHLAQQGYAVSALLSPTVRKEQACLRICLHAYNTKKELNGLLARL